MEATYQATRTIYPKLKFQYSIEKFSLIWYSRWEYKQRLLHSKRLNLWHFQAIKFITKQAYMDSAFIIYNHFLTDMHSQ